MQHKEISLITHISSRTDEKTLMVT